VKTLSLSARRKPKPTNIAPAPVIKNMAFIRDAMSSALLKPPTSAIPIDGNAIISRPITIINIPGTINASVNFFMGIGDVKLALEISSGTTFGIAFESNLIRGGVNVSWKGNIVINHQAVSPRDNRIKSEIPFIANLGTQNV